MPGLAGQESQARSSTGLTDRERPLDAVAPDPASGSAPAAAMAMVAPAHPGDPRWPWITRVGPMRRFNFRRVYVQNTLTAMPKASRLYRQWQYLAAMRSISSASLAFLFSTDVGIGLTRWPSRLFPRPRRVYVGFTQDSHWPRRRIARLGDALRQFDTVTVFTEEERQVYLQRYCLSQDRVRVIPLHTDETDGYRQYPDESPIEGPYVVSLGSPNRRFMPVAEVCNRRGIRLIVITRPSHANDSLDDLRRMGVTVITDADKLRALTYLKHARAAVMVFDDPSLPGGFTTLVHAMFLRTPFIVSECLGVREHVSDGETGLVTPHNDAAALDEAIGSLMRDRDLAERFSRNAFQRALERHSLEAAAESFHRLACEILQGM